MKNLALNYFLSLLLLSTLGCISSKEITTNNSSEIRGKDQEMREKIKQIEVQEYPPEIYTDSVSSAFCEYLQYIDFALLEKTLNGISTDEGMYRYETDTTQVTWSHHRLGFLIRSLLSFTTNGERYSQEIINDIDDKTQSQCPDQYMFYLKIQKMFNDKIRELEIKRMN